MASRDGKNWAATTRLPVATIPLRKPRRLTFSMVAWAGAMSDPCRSRLDGGGDALVAAAAADVAAHYVVDFGLGRVLRLGQQCCRLHDLAGLAIAALRHVECPPSLLHRVIALGVEPFDGRHRATVDIADRGSTGPGGLAVDAQLDHGHFLPVS